MMNVSNTYHRPLLMAIHVISWLLVLGFPLVMADWGGNFNWKRCIRDEMLPVSSLIVFYINYVWLVPRYFLNKKVRRFFLLSLVVVVVMSLLLHFGLGYLFLPEPRIIPGTDARVPLMPSWFFLSRHLMMMVFVTGLSTAIRISFRWREAEEQLLEAEQEKTEAELMNLKNQVSPHFLLNTLNNIYALIAFNRDKAQEAVLELSRLLRHMLYENQSALVSLAKELEFINHYISLMRIRLSDSVKLTVKLEAGSRPLDVAPLIFISLIENAFKHGISPTEASFIDIEIQGDDEGYIRCRITNSNFPKFANDKSGSGIGLEQVHRRLELIYAGRYDWQKSVSEDGRKYTSLLIIETIPS